MEEFRRAKCKMQQAVKKAKSEHKRKLEYQFASNNTRTVWQGLQQITQYRQSAAAIDNSDPSFPDQLNDFNSRFDKLNTSSEQRPLPAGTSLSPSFTGQETVWETEPRVQTTSSHPPRETAPTNFLRPSATSTTPLSSSAEFQSVSKLQPSYPFPRSPRSPG